MDLDPVAAVATAGDAVSGRQLAVWRVFVGPVLWLMTLANSAVIVALWVAGGNISGVHGAGLLLTSVGRITGLLGAFLLLIELLLISRLPPLERLVGFDRLTVWHRLNGKLCLSLILAHVVFITIGYAMTDRISVVREAVTLLQQYPGMVAATVGTGLLVLAVISSLVIVRRRLRYEAWYVVHLTAYAGIMLGWVHQIPTGNEFITNSAAASYWTALYLIPLALLVLFRVGHPTLQALLHRLRVSEVVREGEGVISLRITGRHLERLGARPGQFFLWRFLAPGRWWEAHPFSLSAAPNGRSLRITVKDSGDFTHRIGSIKPGTWVLAEGQVGVFTEEVRRRDAVALIAGGIGITPIRALLEEMAGDVIVIYRVPGDDAAIFRSELDALARDRGFTLRYVTGERGAHRDETLLSAEHLRRLIPDITDRDVYACGPPVMVREIERNVRRAGVPLRHVHVEKFAL